jgi:hypothetical protein
MTTQGAAGPLPARARMDAERACLLYGHVRVERIAPDNEQLGGARGGDAVAYKYLDFGEGAQAIVARVAPGSSPTRVEVVLDRSWGAAVGVLEVPGGGDGRAFGTRSAKVEIPRGVHAVWLRFSGEGADLARLDWFAFE